MTDFKQMENTTYVDGFAFPIRIKDLAIYKDAAMRIANIWKEYGALGYNEFIGDDMHIEGTHSFIEALAVQKGETIIFGWVTFPNKSVRDQAIKNIAQDERMSSIMAPIIQNENPIFDSNKMLYGGFKAFISVV